MATAFRFLGQYVQVVLSGFLFVALHCSICRAEPDKTVFPSRAEFATKMRALQPHMTEAQVKAILGAPDSEIRDSGGAEWFFGAGEVSHCLLLGDAVFNEKGLLIAWSHNQWETPPKSVISEKELRHNLDILGTLDKLDGLSSDGPFNSLGYIKAANELLPEGKVKILASAREWLRIQAASPSDNFLYLLQILFEPAPAHSLSLQGIWPFARPAYPANVDRVPRFPMVLIGNVPVNAYYTIRDGITDASELPAFVSYIEKNFQLRKKPLQPPPNPLDLIEKFEASDQWLFGQSYLAKEGNRTFTYRPEHWMNETHIPVAPMPASEALKVKEYVRSGARQMLMRNLLQLVAPVYPPARQYIAGVEGYHLRITPERWQQMRDEVAKLNLKWDSQKNEYVVSH